MSPTQRTLARLRGLGYKAAVVEHWNHYAKIRQDLFGCIDIVAVGHGRTLGVQACAAASISARAAKMRACIALPELTGAGWAMLVMGWRKPAKARSWVCRTVRVGDAPRTGPVDCSGAVDGNADSLPDPIFSSDAVDSPGA